VETSAFVSHFRTTFPDLVGKAVAVALSGGRDSVALLHLLRDPALDLELSAIHVHHGLRGSESDADADFCRRICIDIEVSITIVQLPRDNQRPRGGEAAWRRRRYRALIDHKLAEDLPAVATAHHRDDIADGVLVQLLRGAGPRAMAGISARTEDGIIRPLLPFSRSQLTEWLRMRDIDWRDDSSNIDTARLRNRVRLELMPRLEAASPALRDHLVHLAGALAEDEAFMAAELVERVGFADPWDPDAGVPVAALRELPRALRARWLHGQMLTLGVRHATRRQLELFHLMLDEGRPRSVSMGQRWRLRSARHRIWAEPPVSPKVSELVLTDGAETGLGIPGWTVRMSTFDAPHPRARWRWRPHSADAPITLRPSRSGDRLDPSSGATGSVRGLLAKHLPRHLRSAWPVCCENDMIHWIPGVWQDSNPGDPSNRIVEVIRQ
jgi:tRNA(Ile)-lysidine synthase